MTIISTYLKNIEKALATGHATEHTYRPTLKEFIESLAEDIEATGDSAVEAVRYTEPSPSLNPSRQGREDIRCRSSHQGSEGNGQQGTGRVWINKTQYFDGVPPEVWAFHIGGYQVCQKWLKDRKGRQLTYDDITHYQRIVAALAETIRLMAAIDETINRHDGWPIV